MTLFGNGAGPERWMTSWINGSFPAVAQGKGKCEEVNNGPMLDRIHG